MTSNASKKLLIKKYGLGFNKGLKIINLRDILLLSFYLVAVVFWSFETLDIEHQALWTSTNILFSIYSTLSWMDLEFRGGIQVYVERFFLTNTLLYSQVWANRLTATEQAYRLNISKYADANCKTVLLNDDIFDFLYSEVRAKKFSLGKAITDFQSNEKLAGLSGNLREIVLKSRLTVKTFDRSTPDVLSTEKVSPVTFLGIFKVSLELFQQNLESLQSDIKNKAPPYALSTDYLLDNFGNPAIDRFSTLRNSWSGSLDYHRETLATLKTLFITVQPNETSKRISIYQGIFSFLYLIFVAGGLYLASTTNEWLVDLLVQYKNLRKEEVKLHNLILTHRHSFLQKYKYDEIMMVGNYMKTSYTNLDAYAISNFESSREVRVKTKNLSRNTRTLNRANKITNDISLRSIKTMRVVVLSTIALVILYIAVFLTNRSSFIKTNDKMSFYTNAYEVVTSAYHFYLSHSMYVLFGNFIYISGRRPSTEIGESQNSLPMISLIQFMTNERSNLQEFFGGQDGNNIDELLFENICDKISKTKEGYSTDYYVCKQNRYASKGFLSFMYHQRDMLGEIRKLVGDDKDFLNRSEREWLLFPFQEFLYDIPIISFRLTSKIVFETVYYTLLPAGERAIDRILSTLEQRIYILSRVVPIIANIVFLAFFILLVFGTLIRDLHLASETLFNMLPEIMIGNKLIIRKFNETYAIKY